MRIIHVVRQYTPSVGGMEEVVRNLALQQLKTANCQPSVITLDHVFREPERRLPHHETIDGVPVRRLSYTGSERYPLCPQVLGSLRNADVVHVHAIDFFFDYLAWTRAIHRTPLIASTHGGFFHSDFATRLKKLYFQSMTRLSALSYRRIIATSENDGEVFGQIVDAPRLQVIENGVDVDKFDDASSRTLQPTLIYFGRWSVNKGLLEVLDVLAALCAQQPETPWQLIIAGREYDLDAKAIQVQAALKGVGACVRIVPGPTNEALRAHIAQSSYFICMSRHEGFGIAPIEGMSAGLIPILSSIPPFRRLVDNSRLGLVIDAATATDQAQQIAHLHSRYLLHEGSHQHDRDAARVASKAYSWTDVAARYLQQYEKTLENS